MIKQELPYTPLSDKRLLSIKEFQIYTGLGRNSALKLSITAKCRIYVGRSIVAQLSRQKSKIFIMN